VQIVDFGLGTTGTQASMMRDIVGTWIYMSPEVFKGKHSPYPVDT
jgi:serine/threonine protein kinase